MTTISEDYLQNKILRKILQPGTPKRYMLCPRCLQLTSVFPVGFTSGVLRTVDITILLDFQDLTMWPSIPSIRSAVAP